MLEGSISKGFQTGQERHGHMRVKYRKSDVSIIAETMGEGNAGEVLGGLEVP